MKTQLLAIAAIFVVPLSFSQNLQISGGNNFSAAVCDNQQVFVWGANSSNQLGITAGDVPVAAAYSNTPTSVLRGNVSNVAGTTTYGNLPAIRQVDAGSGAHVLGLSCAKQVWAWGDNTKGQLGRNTLITSAVPQRVLRGTQAANVNANDPNGIFLNNIFYVSGGNNSSYALETTTGRVLAWGENTNGQLGDGTTTDRPTPVYVLTAAATPLTNIVQIEGGDNCAYALDINGNVWSWGDNNGNVLGRPGAGIQSYAARVVQGDPNNNGYSGTPAPTVYLGGIVQISGGDTHCLALDANGNVWSFGGDWGEGQLGRAGGSVYQDDARKVSIPGLGTYATAANQFLGNGTDGKAVYVSAGQAVSAVVMANGRVVTFGGRGLYNSGATPTAPAGSIACPAPAGDMIVAGSLGDNATDCNSGTCNGKATMFSRTPVYVRDATGAILTGITQVSDGDAWFYAISSSGTAYAWGWNRRGELGLGDYSDRCRAVPFTLPAGCTFSDPCPPKPNLGADVTTCPVFSTTLNSNVPQTYSSWKYTWEYRAGMGAWTTLGAAMGNNPTYNPANSLGQYRVTITDNRGTVPFLCAACPVYLDTITFTEIANPYTVDACADNATSLARFEVTAPLGTQVKWYTNPIGGTALNPSDVNPVITVPFTSTNTSTPGCARALFAEDVTSFAGVLRPGTTVASSPCAGAGGTETGNRSPLQIEVTQNMTFTGLNFIQPNNTNPYSATYSFRIYANDPTIGYNCGSCTPANSKLGDRGALLYTSPGTIFGGPGNAGDIVRTLTGSFALTGTPASPTKYWIEVSGGDVKYLNCNPAVTQTGVAVPIWTTPNVSSPAGMRGLIATHDGSPNGNSHLFNLTFNVGTAYSCTRILVCVSSSCVLPVEFTSFYVQPKGAGAKIDWTTANEKNSSHFIVEKSIDGSNFSEIGKVMAAGNSASSLTYSFDDPKLSAGTTYYRLAQYDIDGTVRYSEIRSLTKDGVSDVQIVPNPNNGTFILSLLGAGDVANKVSILNALGQVVYIAPETTANTRSIDIQHLASGVYYLQVTTDEGTIVKKLVRE
ncbi:MAG: T9SS type A sorting domain-containing protein [Cytophagaceae bacterium]|nr:T9SS type A sorting domain-containing protein [Cytophagaceae bacterium]